MFIAVLFINATNWKQLKCLFTRKFINNLWYIHSTQHLICPTTQVNLKTIVLSKKTRHK